MDREARRAAAAAYKERKIPAGIFALRCSAADRCWVGKALDTGSARNRLWFTLGRGVHMNDELQHVWRAHGPDSFSFDVVETIDQDLTTYSRDQMLKERLAFWQAELNAQVIR